MRHFIKDLYKTEVEKCTFLGSERVEKISKGAQIRTFVVGGFLWMEDETIKTGIQLISDKFEVASLNLLRLQDEKGAG